MKENTESLASSKADEKPVNGSLHYVLYRDTIRLSASGAYHNFKERVVEWYLKQTKIRVAQECLLR